MLADFEEDRRVHRGREVTLPALLGAALLRLGTIDSSVAGIAGAASGALQKGLGVTVSADPHLQKMLEKLTSSVATDEHDLAATKHQLAETERRVARLEEHLGHLRAHCETLERGATEITERVALIQRDHGRFTEELAAFNERIEPMEHKKKGS
jgi:chromosome segregation ATPase